MVHIDCARMLNQTGVRAGLRGPVPGSGTARAALGAYRKARRPDWIGRLRSLLTGRSCQLLRLSDIQASSPVGNSHYAGTRPVAIRQIQGSEGRCGDFDAGFRPLCAHNRGRWTSVAEARLRGVSLPPVELIQVGEVYYVRDGHHRISVANALGQEHIDAEVAVWEVEEAPRRVRRAPQMRLATQPA
jgi:hypothetical protein